MNSDEVMPAGDDEPSWKQRAVERSTRAAKLRAEQRVQRFLDAAQTVVTDKGTTDFTVQEVVDCSRQSLRSFYQHFDGKQSADGRRLPRPPFPGRLSRPRGRP
jgi:hypothetical protein